MRPSIAPASEQLVPRCSMQTYHCANQLDPLEDIKWSGHWRQQLHIQMTGCKHTGKASIGLKLSDEAIRVAVTHRLGCRACEPYTYVMCFW